MTIPEFLERLKETSGPWTVWDEDGAIRSGGHCPLTALAAPIDPDKVSNSNDWDSAAAILDMDYDDARRIVDAADYETHDDDGIDMALREQLLAATVNRP